MRVYLIEEPAVGQVKVGVSREPYRRMASLQGERETQLFLRHEHDAGSKSAAYALERATHDVLSASRVVGEWFAVTVPRALEALEIARVAPPPRRKTKATTRRTKLMCLRFTPDEIALLNDLGAQYGSKKNAVALALQALDDTDITSWSVERLMMEVARRID